MAVRWSDIDAPRLEAFPVFGQLRLKHLVSAQPTEQRLAGVVSGHVLNEKRRGRQVSGQLADQLVERFQSPRRRADNNDVSPLMSLHGTAAFLAPTPGSTSELVTIIRTLAAPKIIARQLPLQR